MTALPYVSVLIPARNEEADIEACLDAVLAQDYPADCLEIVVVDGNSDDRTARLAEERLSVAEARRARVVANDGGTTPKNLNAGLRLLEGEIVCRVDARAIIQVDHVRTCAGILKARPDVAVVGGSQRAAARGQSARALGIARALNNRWLMGLSRYRRRVGSGPTDTVYLGAFRTQQLREAGGWDERLDTNQDFDLNQRMQHRGVIWFESALSTAYIPRESLGQLWSQYRRFGRWKVRYWRLTGSRPRPRQLVLIVVPLALLLTLPSMLRSRHRGRVLASGIAAALALEARGAQDPAAGPLGHVYALAASACVAGGWLSGLAAGVLDGDK